VAEVLGRLSEQQRRGAARKLDNLKAPENIAGGVGGGLALLPSNNLGNLGLITRTENI
jgi:hypothetical protein